MSQSVDKLAAMILLGGSVRGNPLEDASGRALMNLPIRADRSILDFWHRSAEQLTRVLRIENLPVRVLIGQPSRTPTAHTSFPHAPLSIEQDRGELRGPGGVLADLATEFADDQFLLVASGNQIPVEPLGDLVTSLFEKANDGAILTHDDGMPVTLFLVACRTLRDIPKVGFVDFKEQSLPKIAAEFDIRVVRWPKPALRAVRTREDYLEALRVLYAASESHPVPNLGRAHEPWQPIFSIVEEGAEIAEGVDLLDSVVLRGARVEEGAVVVRSLLCPGAVVSCGRMIHDTTLTP